MNEESVKIEYHYGFYAATHAEYHAFREMLDFLQEQELGVEPVRLDMLIIKRDGPSLREAPRASLRHSRPTRRRKPVGLRKSSCLADPRHALPRRSTPT